jgi:ABC-type sugar transport system, permease component
MANASVKPIKRKKIKLSNGDKVFNVFNYLIFGILTIVCIFPLYYIFINTISSNDLTNRGLISFYPMQIQFTNYLSVTQIPGLASAAFISVARTVLGTCCTVAASAFLGFLFTKNQMWGRKFWYRFIIVTMYFNAGLIPWYLTMYNLGLTNNFLAYILPAIVQPFNIILVKTYVENTPPALQEAAEIDGAGDFTIFVKVILPIITPILATIAIFSAVAQWNNYIDTLLLMTDDRLFSLQYMLWTYINQADSLAAELRNNPQSIGLAKSLATQQTALSVRMTVSIIVVLPIICVYPFFQKYFVRGIMIGAVKG